MTADLSEGETESRPLNAPAEQRFQGETDVGPSKRDRFKSGGHWKEAKEVEELGEEQGGDVVDLDKDNRETADLTTGFKDGLKGRTRSVKHDVSVQGMQRGARLPSRESRKVEVLSSEGYRDEETEEDDMVEGDGPVAEVASEPKRKPQQQQQEHPQLQQQQQKQSREQQVQQQMPQLGKESRQEQAAPAAAAAAQNPVSPVGWESFLPQSNIKVLLAEDDDSTRQVVCALLRNCSYEVSAVANGMQAWEMLENPNNDFDLVLTDVVMPCLSGVGLLTKIMSNESAKRIPVIMMSSHDSLDIVFRCLSKGAADFLVKPVRKNELKNLWQHVWRCQSSCGSGSGGSGSGSGNGLKVGRQKSKVGSGNHTGSNDGSDDNSSGLNVRGGSDNGSGTQAVVHINHKQKRDKPDIKDSQATSLQKESDQQMGQDLEMATRRPSLDMEKAPKPDNHDGAEARQDDSPSASGNSDNKRSTSNAGRAIDLIGGIAFQNNEDVDDGVESGEGAEGSDRGASNSPANDKCVTSSNSPPLLELSLKRPRAPGEDDGQEKRVLRHSGGSAFSRYSTNGTTIQQIPGGAPLSLSGFPVGAAYGTHSLSPATDQLGAGNNGQVHFPMPMDRAGSSKGSGEGASNPQPMHLRASHKGKGQDVGSSMVGSSIPEGYNQQVKDEAVSVSPMSGQGRPTSIPLPPRGMIYEGVPGAYGHGQAIHQVYYSHSGAPPWASGGAHISDRGQVFYHPRGNDPGSHTAHHSSHHHQQHQHQHQQQQQQQSHHHSSHHHQQQAHSRLAQPFAQSQQDDQVVTNQASGAPGCGSSNMADGNTWQSGSSNGYGSTGNGNGSVNGSGSGSNNMNNQNGQSTAAVNPAENVADGAVVNGNASGGPVSTVNNHEQNRFNRREAALNKFRQKRKERCFEKKVRYQSRKRLAEQRPRVRGQFVRQPVYDPNAGNEMAD
ncbi:unnamed protein product [Calypogeia fissa]